MSTDETKYLILDQIYGWNEDPPRGKVADGLATTPEGYRRLFALPGRSSLLVDSELQKSAFICPAAIAMNPYGKVGVVDAAASTVSLTDTGLTQIEKVPSIGGPGSSARRLLEPRGIDFLKSGAIVIADTANHRVQIFSDTQHALVQSWGAVDADGNPASGNGQKNFQWPWSVVTDGCGTVYVVDRGNHRVQKIREDGTWIAEIGADLLLDPTRIATGPDGLIAVVDAGQQAVFLFSPRRALARSLSNVRNPRSVEFGSDGMLYVGDATGLISIYTPGENEKYNFVGQGSSSTDGEILDLAWVSGSDPFLLAIIKEKDQVQRQRLWRIEPVGTFQNEGRLLTSAINSRLEKCQWHRISLTASIPSAETSSDSSARGTTDFGAGSIQIESYTSDSRDLKTGIPESSWKLCVLSGDDDPDCLVQSGPGQYLWLRITLKSNGIESPVLKRIKAYYPRSGYLQYLPAVYQEDNDGRLFLDRFLAIFQTEFDKFDQTIDEMWRLFDPASVSEENFAWLASWMGLTIQPDSLIDQRCRFECVSEQDCQPPPACPSNSENEVPSIRAPLEWSSAKKREMLKNAMGTYSVRGTVKGVEQAIRDHTGVQFATILEHFRLRRWPVLSILASQPPDTDPCAPVEEPQRGRCGDEIRDRKISLPLDGSVRLWSRDFYKRLQLDTYSQVGNFQLTSNPEPILEPLTWGANRFSVFFPASPYNVAETKQKVAQVVEREKPAHTHAELCPVLPRMRVGVQATVGADAVVGAISHLVLNSLATLNYDAILSCSKDEKRLRALGTASRLRTGITTKLS